MKGFDFFTTDYRNYKMSLLKKIFKSTTEERATNLEWIPLTDLAALEEITAISKNETVLIFKHSTRCGVSRIAKRNFENSFDGSESILKAYYLDLLSYRAISNEIAASYQVQHQSPQLLVIKSGVAVAHASHYKIADIDMNAHLTVR